MVSDCTVSVRGWSACRSPYGRGLGPRHAPSRHLPLREPAARITPPSAIGHGTIENSLIQYDRPDGQAPKQARVRLLEVGPDRALDEARAALHRDVVVTKQRHSLWRDNVKFHVDEVPRARFLPRDRGHRQGRDPAGRPGSRTTIPCEKTINSHASYHGSVA